MTSSRKQCVIVNTAVLVMVLIVCGIDCGDNGSSQQQEDENTSESGSDTGEMGEGDGITSAPHGGDGDGAPEPSPSGGDSQALVIQSISPSVGSENVSLRPRVSAQFESAVPQFDGVIVSISPPVEGRTLRARETVEAVLVLDRELQPATDYTVTVQAPAPGGAALSTIATTTFRTMGVPAVSELFPPADATGVPLNAAMGLRMSLSGSIPPDLAVSLTVSGFETVPLPLDRETRMALWNPPRNLPDGATIYAQARLSYTDSEEAVIQHDSSWSFSTPDLWTRDVSDNRARPNWVDKGAAAGFASDGSLYAVGEETLRTNSTLWISKYRPDNMTLQWRRVFEEDYTKGTSLALDARNIFVGGWRGLADAYNKGYLVSLSDSGEYRWHRTIDLGTVGVRVYGMAAQGSAVYAGGHSTGGGGGPPESRRQRMIHKVSKEGGLDLWTSPRVMSDGSPSEIFAMTSGSDGIVYYAGYRSATGSGKDVLLGKLDPSSDTTSEASFSAPNDQIARAVSFVEEDDGRYLYVAGENNGQIFWQVYRCNESGDPFSAVGDEIVEGTGVATGVVAVWDASEAKSRVFVVGRAESPSQGLQIWSREYDSAIAAGLSTKTPVAVAELVGEGGRDEGQGVAANSEFVATIGTTADEDDAFAEDIRLSVLRRDGSGSPQVVAFNGTQTTRLRGGGGMLQFGVDEDGEVHVPASLGRWDSASQRFIFEAWILAFDHLGNKRWEVGRDDFFGGRPSTASFAVNTIVPVGERLYLGGYLDDSLFLQRLNADGTVDASFGEAYTWKIDDPLVSCRCQSILPQGNGDLVFFGWCRRYGDSAHLSPLYDAPFFLRLGCPGGSSSCRQVWFKEEQWANDNLGYEGAFHAIQLPEGDLMFAGLAKDSEHANAPWLYRIRPDGTIPEGWGPQGRILPELGSGFWWIAPRADGTFVGTVIQYPSANLRKKVAVFDRDGNVLHQWELTREAYFPDWTTYSYTDQVVVDDEGNIYINASGTKLITTGIRQGPRPVVAVLSFDSTGNLRWTRTYDGRRGSLFYNPVKKVIMALNGSPVPPGIVTLRLFDKNGNTAD